MKSPVSRYRIIAAFLVVALSVVTAASAQDAAPNRLTDEELADGWILLFDGETLFGWRPVAKADWTVRDGTIHVGSGEQGLLRTTTQFTDFAFKADFLCDADTNSGVFLRTSPAPDNLKRDCYELNIAPGDNPFPTGSLVQRTEADAVAESSGSWRTLEATVLGGKVAVALDGKRVLEYDDPDPMGRGFIGLQHNQGEIRFRNVKLKPLATTSLFDGKTLDGWKTYPEMPSVFSVTPDGYLNVKNGRGQLETTGEYGDFVLQLDCFSNGKHLNSGIFFRCIPGDTMMGYECQIQNGFEGDDRTKPIDCGTGGIFRRQNARRVVSDDFTWFSKTLIAEGPHVAAWVNGIQVTDWTDKRPPHENPRKGLRTTPGTIMIQGHDPTTDLSFRNLKIAKMRKRR